MKYGEIPREEVAAQPMRRKLRILQGATDPRRVFLVFFILPMGILLFGFGICTHPGGESPTAQTNTFVHQRDFVEKYTRLDAPQRKEESTCRIQNACISMTRNEFHLLLPTSMSNAPHVLLTGCRHAGVQMSVSTPPLDAQYHTEDLLLGVFPGNRSGSLAHFTLESGVLIDMAETILGDRTLSTEKFVFEKYIRKDGGPWHVSSSKEPSLSVRRMNTLPAVLVDPLVRDGGLDKSRWIVEFTRSLLQSSGSPPYFMSPPRDPNGRETHCFRSIWTPPRGLTSVRRRHLADYSVFHEMGVAKKPRLALCNSKQTTLSVLILNRQKTRVISNMEEVRDAVRTALHSYFENIKIEEIIFDNKTFQEQVTAMQGADVVIAAHGASIANALFLREKSLLLEISPFCYNFPWFQEGGKRSFDSDTRFVVCGPDLERFNSTIRHWCRKDHSCEGLINKFQRLMAAADMDKVHTNISYFNRYQTCSELQANIFSNRGLKSQRLLPDKRRILSQLKPWAAERCS